MVRLPVDGAGTVGLAALHSGIALETDGIETDSDYQRAAAAGSAFGSGALFGDPHVDCRQTHGTRRLA
jgi:hypothetical protein